MHHDASRFREFDKADREVAELQRLLLPERLPVVPGWDLASHYRPCDASGGDYYGFQRRTSDRLLMLVADVSGHGARAAIVMAMLRAWLCSHELLDRPTSNTATEINTLLLRIEGLGVFVTGVFVNIDLQDGSFRYINCGHPWPRIVRATGGVEHLRAGHCLPMGVCDDLGLAGPGTDVLVVGDSLVIHTDGISEARRGDGVMFDDQRLDEAIVGGGGAAATLDRLLASVAVFLGGAPQRDDECVLVVKRTA